MSGRAQQAGQTERAHGGQVCAGTAGRHHITSIRGAGVASTRVAGGISRTVPWAQQWRPDSFTCGFTVTGLAAKHVAGSCSGTGNSWLHRANTARRPQCLQSVRGDMADDRRMSGEAFRPWLAGWRRTPASVGKNANTYPGNGLVSAELARETGYPNQKQARGSPGNGLVRSFFAHEVARETVTYKKYTKRVCVLCCFINALLRWIAHHGGILQKQRSLPDSMGGGKSVPRGGDK
jgi:hypothetical protein